MLALSLPRENVTSHSVSLDRIGSRIRATSERQLACRYAQSSAPTWPLSRRRSGRSRAPRIQPGRASASRRDVSLVLYSPASFPAARPLPDGSPRVAHPRTCPAMRCLRMRLCACSWPVVGWAGCSPRFACVMRARTSRSSSARRRTARSVGRSSSRPTA